MSETIEEQLVEGMSFLSALFEVDWQAASSIFQEDALPDLIMDAVDMFPVSSQVSLSVAHLLSQACGHKSCRALITSQVLQWLTGKSRQTNDSVLRGAAAVALVKLSRGAGENGIDVEKNRELSSDDGDLVELMRGLVVNESKTSSVADAIEGLAYMSTNARVKEALAGDTSFLKRLFSVVPRRKGTGTSSQFIQESAKSPLYGVVTIISNICSYRPRLTEEEAQIEKLKQMAKTPGSMSGGRINEDDTLEDDEHVKARGVKMIQSGVLDVLTSTVRATESRAVRLAVGKALLSLVENIENRGKVLQSGGAKALMVIIQGILPSSNARTRLLSPQLDLPEIEVIQALAKLAITSSPLQVFGPNEGALYDAIRPFALMLVQHTSNLLQRFEALMALTNLSSQGSEIANKIACAGGLMDKVELLILEDHTLVRRASTELICNLVGGCEDVFNRYGGKHSEASNSKLQVLVALCDVDDLPTRLAASGAVATLTSSQDACQALIQLQRERRRVLPIFGHLVDQSIGTYEEEQHDNNNQSAPNPGLVHRGAVCIRNLLYSIRDTAIRKELALEADRAGIVRVLVAVIKSAGNTESPALRPAAETLKWLLESGLEVAV
ncbi:uncharacterized protein FIBRA_06648 [Fibroporia radiculosa]|uniref:UNC-45/Cro1/She4 central domain-containing protein n=1 Tax=Fibroporia radiculosa TaxID=599839 RepID=J4GC43_9APHY|nr:uncharacterized protein FIBRA_06648 [Fibroporia radiculosa]CCM04468.1 predicted protein [Fibroporia radiculosa]